MKKVQLTINGKKEERNIPTSWDQVTFEQFLNLESSGDDPIKVLALFTGIDHDLLLKAKIKDFSNILSEGLKFLSQKPELSIPKTILGYRIPDNLEFEQVQQYVDLKQAIKESAALTPQEQLKRYCLYIATYACMSKHGKYDYQISESMQDEFLKAPCTEVMGIGNFTLVKLAGLKINTGVNYRQRVPVMKRLRLVIRAFMLRMGFRLRLTT